MTERLDRPNDEYCDDRDIRFQEKKTDMREDLKRDLIQAICDNERNHRHHFIYKEICTYIRSRFESKHGAFWGCVVDPRYIMAWNTAGTYAHFLYRGIDFHFWQITH